MMTELHSSTCIKSLSEVVARHGMLSPLIHFDSHHLESFVLRLDFQPMA